MIRSYFTIPWSPPSPYKIKKRDSLRVIKKKKSKWVSEEYRNPCYAWFGVTKDGTDPKE